MKNQTLGYVFAFLAAICAFPFGCKALDTPITYIEEMPEEDFALTETNTAIVTRALVAISVSEAHVEPKIYLKAAGLIELAAEDLRTQYWDTMFEDVLVKSGLTLDEAKALMIVVKQQMPFQLGIPQVPLGYRARHFLVTFAKALRDGASGRVTEDDKKAAVELQQ